MAFRAAVITFPGSNCDRDMAVAIERVSGITPMRVWHGDAHLPEDLDFEVIPGLSSELRQKLQAARPETLARAARIPGMTPAALSLLLVHAQRRGGAADAAVGG